MESWREAVGEFGTAHKAFLQLLMKKNLILHEEVGSAFLKLYSRHYDDANVRSNELDAAQNRQLVNALMQCVNAKLRMIGMSMLEVLDETRRATEYVTIISDRVYSEVMLQASGFTTDELAKFQIWLKMMYGSQNETISNTDDAINNLDKNGANASIEGVGGGIGELALDRLLNSRIGNLSASGAQKLLTKFIAAQWLVVDEGRDTVRLHPKAMAELSNGLQMEYRLPTCELCRRAIFLRRLAYICTCEFTYHASCVIKANRTAPPKCANDICGEILTEDLIETTAFDEDLTAAVNVAADATPAARQRKRRFTAATDCDAEEANDRDSMQGRNAIACQISRSPNMC